MCSSRIEMKQLVELERLARVEAGGGLVEAEQRRIGAHRAGDLEPTLRAVRQLAGGIVGAVDQADLVEPVLGALDRGALGGAVARRAEQAEHGEAARQHQRVVVRDHQVFEHRHALEETDVLEGARHLGAPGDFVAGHALEQVEFALLRSIACWFADRVSASTSAADARAAARQRQAPFGRLVEAGDAVEHRRLAGAVGADERGDVAAPDLEREVVDGDEAAEAHRQMLDDEQGIGPPAHQPCPSLTSEPDTAFLSLRKIDGERVDTKPRGRTTIITTIARPNSRPRYCAGSNSGMANTSNSASGSPVERAQRRRRGRPGRSPTCAASRRERMTSERGDADAHRRDAGPVRHDRAQEIELAQQLEAADQEHRRQRDADLRAHAAEHDDGQNRRRLDEGEALGADEALPHGEEGAGQAAEEGAEREGGELGVGGVDAERAAGDFVLAQRLPGAADRQPAQPHGDEVGEQRQAEDDVVEEHLAVQRRDSRGGRRRRSRSARRRSAGRRR